MPRNNLSLWAIVYINSNGDLEDDIWSAYSMADLTQQLNEAFGDDVQVRVVKLAKGEEYAWRRTPVQTFELEESID